GAVQGEPRFVFRMHWDHAPPLTRPPGHPLPIGWGEGRGEGAVHGEPPFVFRMHWDHEPDWHPSPCPRPARRGEGGRRPGEGQFMESFHDLAIVHRSYEPTPNPSGGGESMSGHACRVPFLGGASGGSVYGEAGVRGIKCSPTY